MGKMQEEIKALRRQNTHLQNVVQRQRQHLSELTGAVQDYVHRQGKRQRGDGCLRQDLW